MKYQIKGNYFNGNFVTPTSCEDGPDQTITRKSPADLNTTLWELSIDYQHIDNATESAVSGFHFWRKLTISERINFLKKFQEQVIKHRELMEEAISLETGKPLWEAKTEVNSVIGKVDVTIEASLPRVTHQHFNEIMPGNKGHLLFKPIGPCLIIGPFNFPCHLANTQILSALIAGNSVIFKPSEKTSYSAQILISCFHEAGFPKGVVNLLQGDGEIARRLVKIKEIKGVFFTGSKEIGINILKNTYHDLTKLVALELGGKNPAIVHNDANVDHAIQELVKGCYLTTGQRCTSTSIVIVHRSIQDEFVQKFHQLSKRVITDHPINHEIPPLMGPLVDKKAIDNYLLFMGMAKREGLEEIMRGKHLEKKYPGHYVSPSIHLAEKFNHKSHFLTSEIFGPNCTIIPYDEIEEAITISNSTEYGLAAAVFTKSQNIYEVCSQDIDTGLLNLNRSTCGASPKLPFGGVKNSGNYRPASVAMIDSCVYQMTGLELLEDNPTDIDNMLGIK